MKELLRRHFCTMTNCEFTRRRSATCLSTGFSAPFLSFSFIRATDKSPRDTKDDRVEKWRCECCPITSNAINYCARDVRASAPCFWARSEHARMKVEDETITGNICDAVVEHARDISRPYSLDSSIVPSSHSFSFTTT